MYKDKQPQQQERHCKRNKADNNQALRARLCLRRHAEGRNEATPSYRESAASNGYLCETILVDYERLGAGKSWRSVADFLAQSQRNEKADSSLTTPKLRKVWSPVDSS
jgi:hypothetical protein